MTQGLQIVRDAADSSVRIRIGTVEEDRTRTTSLVDGSSSDVIESPVARPRVLIVDDEQALARSMARALSAYETSIAHDGVQALQLMRAIEFDLVLCDVMMPGMGGMDVYDALANEPAQLSRIVFMTGGAFGDRARAFLDSIPNARLDKPISIGELRRFVSVRVAGR